MVRPKTILWVDDEVEGLAAHRRYLEDQGFTVAAAAHGDDALALLRRQPYSIVLLDEQMPGRRGLELIGEIRALDPAMPVVMVTQSEDEGTLREAIGIEVDDYLVKPVQPRQILSVITRLLEGDRIRQQRLARDFVTRFRELEGRRGGNLAWREWIELVAEPARWEVLRDLVTPLFDVEESHYYSILPTATPFARNAIFSGLFPMEIAARHPAWWGQPSDEESLNAHEGELLTEQLQELVGRPVPVRYEKVFSSGEGDLVRRLPAHLAQDGVTALVFNSVDQLTHRRYEFGEDLKSKDPEAAILVEDLKGFGLPGMGLGVRLLLATSDRFFVYPTKLREYQARYRGSFLHGGVTPEEVILPVALLTPRRAGTTPAGKGGAR